MVRLVEAQTRALAQCGGCMVKGLFPDRNVSRLLQGNVLPLGADCRRAGNRARVKCLIMDIGSSVDVLVKMYGECCEGCGGKGDCRWYMDEEMMEKIVQAADREV